MDNIADCWACKRVFITSKGVTAISIQCDEIIKRSRIIYVYTHNIYIICKYVFFPGAQFRHLLKQAVIMAPVQAETTCCMGRIWNRVSVIVNLDELCTDSRVVALGLVMAGVLVELLGDSGMIDASVGTWSIA